MLFSIVCLLWSLQANPRHSSHYPTLVFGFDHPDLPPPTFAGNSGTAADEFSLSQLSRVSARATMALFETVGEHVSNFMLNHHLCSIYAVNPIINPGWWFGTFFIFPYIGNNHPNWLSYFSEGWPNHQPEPFFILIKITPVFWRWIAFSDQHGGYFTQHGEFDGKGVL